ncbi:alcohol dehydrogenase catalytic domain-containing protein [Limosilactobacillus fermentum]|uniref:alcohol dehydrogenase catalytic domain-containing protein n=1 Tax=Limosilactobacillus fermentum TaxID=1613 RepID=UPI000DBFB755|nr:alcohol dehydrogenase catalytic domain-containing protein [Limosilactobacillus fermentum]MBC9022892.1 alcohol dehydrogenase catalytic domain-containing protein [Limosilactobacillus fermentum CECT 5716]MCB4716510.1 Zn-dependent alcohol dehydrogenase [Limosilactobacillus fermentum]MCH5398272.1 alcohol dehydrogenase catalytic domain-containing protein [Limosilactobacillus fermentum]MCT3452318.1 Zn-dependent alcohol dehydrogenase [Limosilactobacillus fermentum]MDQ7202977.1 alcohol dehydrogenase
MKSAMFMKKGLVEVQDVDKPTVKNPDDVVIKVLRACVCGSDLWAYRGLDDKPANSINSGHEAIGIVEEVGADITTVKPGDFVIAPFTHGCGHCPACLAGFDGVCQDHSDNFSNGTQAEYYLAQHAQWSLVKVPGKPEDYSEAMLKSFLTLADVMATGYHAARVADVKPGDTVVVMGDGAVGLSTIIAAKLRGAKRIISTSRHNDRRELAAEFGATDNVAERGDEAVEKILAMTNGGADAVLECVGTAQSTDTAMKVGRPGAIVGRVGLPHDATMDMATPFYRNTAVAGGPASVTTYDKDLLLKAVLDGKINPGKVFTKTFTLDEINDAYQAMADRQVIKSYVKVSD